MDWLEIAGKTCVVTGAGGGIGSAIATNLAASGANIAILDVNRDAGETVASGIRQSGGKALAVACNITDPDSVLSALQTVAGEFGPCSVLVNNAAALRNGPLATLSLADWKTVIDVNLTGFFICSQVFGNAMMENEGGSIIHISSMAGSFPQPTSGAYSVSKAGVMMLSQNIAMEWGPKGVRSNVVSPAMVITPLSEVIYADPAIKKHRENAIPLRRIGMPQDIADAVCYLASDRAGYVTGQEILVDGGWATTLLQTVPRPGFD